MYVGLCIYTSMYTWPVTAEFLGDFMGHTLTRVYLPTRTFKAAASNKTKPSIGRPTDRGASWNNGLTD